LISCNNKFCTNPSIKDLQQAAACRELIPKEKPLGIASALIKALARVARIVADGFYISIGNNR